MCDTEHFSDNRELLLCSLPCVRLMVSFGSFVQVEPVVQSSLARRYNLHRPLLDRLYYNPVYHSVTMLRIDLMMNYRCVREVSSLVFWSVLLGSTAVDIMFDA